MRKLPPVALLILSVILLGVSLKRALGHDDASWIMKRHPHCCGPQDCEPVHVSRAYRTKDGWKVAGLEGHVLPGDVRPSIDRRTWACRYLHNNQLRCLFLPVPAMVQLRSPAPVCVDGSTKRRKAPIERGLRCPAAGLSSPAMRQFTGRFQ